MPPPVAFAVPGAIATAKHMAMHASTYLFDVTSFTSATFAAILAQWFWKRLPDWIKEDLSFRNLILRRRRKKKKKNNDGDENAADDDDEVSKEELSHLGSILDKLQGLVESNKTNDTTSPPPQMHAALLAYIQLSGQLRRLQVRQSKRSRKGKHLHSMAPSSPPPLLLLENKKTKSFIENDSKEDDDDDIFDFEDDDQQCKTDHEAPAPPTPIPTPKIDPNNTRDSMYQQKAGPSFSMRELRTPEYQHTLAYATWAYYNNVTTLEEKLEEHDFTLINHNITLDDGTIDQHRRPGHLVYYLAVNPENHQLLLGVRGTSSLEDIFTDCCGRAVPLTHTGTAKTHTMGGDGGDDELLAGSTRIEVTAPATMGMTSEEVADAAAANTPTLDMPTPRRTTSSVMNVVLPSTIAEHGYDGHDEDDAEENPNNITATTRESSVSGEEFFIEIQNEEDLDDTDDGLWRQELLGEEEEEDEADTRRQEQEEQVILEDHDNADGDAYVRCHEGIMISSRRLVEKIVPLITDLIVDCNYQIVLVGHSLGGGAAALIGWMLRHRFPQQLLYTPTSRNDDKYMPQQHPRRQLQVYAFAPPPVLDHDSAIVAASFCTSIVLNADIIPRCSLSNLSVLFECLHKVQQELEKGNMNPVGPKSTAAFIQKLAQGTRSNDLLLSAEELQQIHQDATHERVQLRKPQHLFVPGKVLLVYHPWTNTSSSNPPSSFSHNKSNDHGEEGKRRDSRDDDDDEEDDEAKFVGTDSYDTDKPVRSGDDQDDSDGGGDDDDGYSGCSMPFFRCTETDGTASALQWLEIDGPQLFVDHLTASYYEALGMDYDF